MPPTVVNCPTDIEQTITDGQPTVAVNWTEPTASDDITPADKIRRVSSHVPNQQFGLGTIMVIYIFTDQANNEAKCRFNIIIEGKLTSCIHDYGAIIRKIDFRYPNFI